MAENITPSGLTVIVVDERDRPLCHMPLEAARAQNLCYRRVALLLEAGRDNQVFRWLTRELVGLPIYSPVPGGDNAADFCAARLDSLGIKAPAELRRIRIIPPIPQTDFSFCHLYKGYLGAAFPQGPEQPLFAGSLGDLRALRQFGCEVTAICAHIYHL